MRLCGRKSAEPCRRPGSWPPLAPPWTRPPRHCQLLSRRPPPLLLATTTTPVVCAQVCRPAGGQDTVGARPPWRNPATNAYFPRRPLRRALEVPLTASTLRPSSSSRASAPCVGRRAQDCPARSALGHVYISLQQVGRPLAAEHLNAHLAPNCASLNDGAGAVSQPSTPVCSLATDAAKPPFDEEPSRSPASPIQFGVQHRAWASRMFEAGTGDAAAEAPEGCRESVWGRAGLGISIVGERRPTPLYSVIATIHHGTTPLPSWGGERGRAAKRGTITPDPDALLSIANLSVRGADAPPPDGPCRITSAQHAPESKDDRTGGAKRKRGIPLGRAAPPRGARAMEAGVAGQCPTSWRLGWGRKEDPSQPAPRSGPSDRRSSLVA